VKLDLRDRRLWTTTIILLLIAVPLGFAYYGSTLNSGPTPTPTPYPPPTLEGLWRVEGTILDENQKPIEGVCLAIGPVGCQPVSPRSDKEGKFYFDLPVANVDYDFHFTKAGYQQLDAKVRPTGPSTFTYIMRRG
jgi:hypothetical protein